MRQDGRQHPATLARCVTTWEMPGRKAEGRRVGTAFLAASVNKTSSEPIQRPSTATHPGSDKHELSPTLSVAGTAANHPAPPPDRDEEANRRPRGTFVGRDAAGDRADKRHHKSWIEGRSELWRSVKTMPYAWRTYEDQEAAGLGARRLTDLLTRLAGTGETT